MMRSLWTAASGMTSQQTAVDVIANNLANVNTTGYKTQSAQFKTLLYQTSQSVTTSANGDTKPVGAQVGLGVRNLPSLPREILHPQSWILILQSTEKGSSSSRMRTGISCIQETALSHGVR